MASVARDMLDVCTEADVTTLDRADLIRWIRSLEQQRSAWELRIRASQERESLYARFLQDLTNILAASFQVGHEAINTHAERAAQLTEMMGQILKQVEHI